MAEIPTIKSYEQLLGEMLASYRNRVGVRGLQVGSAVVSYFEVVALYTARASGDNLAVLSANSVDRATGETLRRIAVSERIVPFPARVATGEVRVIDTSFQKLSTKVYAGTKPPNAGSTSVNVSDTAGWPASGQVYLGRGTLNVEGPLAYTSITPVGGYFRLNLASATSRFHNVGETVVLAQGGNRVVPAQTAVRAPASGAEEEVRYSTVTQAVLLDGETEVSGVRVSAQEPGAKGNAVRGAVREFVSEPFAGATVVNDSAFANGRDSETDEEIRERIKKTRLSRGLGTATAIKSLTLGATPSDEQATVISNEIVSDADSATLFVDDGTVYEEKTRGVGVELIVDGALGGESRFQLATGGRQASVARAFLQSTSDGPYDVRGGDRLAVSVGGETYEHTFSDGDFQAPGGATAYELAASINSNSSLGFEAMTSGGGKRLVIQAKAEEFDYLQAVDPTSGRDAALLVALPSSEQQTLRLYKNKRPLVKDGRVASVVTEEQADWSPAIATGDTLVLAVDGTAPITYTVLDADFVAEGTHTTVSSSNTLESWAAVLNAKLTGVTVSVFGEQLRLASNLGANNRSKVEVVASSTLVTKGMFSVAKGLSSQGQGSDYSMSRNTAQVRLSVPLVAGDELTAGTEDTEARVEGSAVLGGTATLPADGYLWLLQDSPGAALVSVGTSSGSLIAVSKPSADVVRYSSSVGSAFSSVQVGDYLIVWSAELSAPNRLEGRVAAVTGSTVDMKVTPAEYAAAVVESGIAFAEGLVALRSAVPPQKFKMVSGSRTLTSIRQELQGQSETLRFSVVDDERLVVSTNTRAPSLGRLLVVTADSSGALVGLVPGDESASQGSLAGAVATSAPEADMPLFVHTGVAAPGYSADPPNSFVASVVTDQDLDALGMGPNHLLKALHPYGGVDDAQPAGEAVQVSGLSGTTATLHSDRLLRRLREDDRVYSASPLDFGHADTVVAVLDGDAGGKSFEVQLYRRLAANNTHASSATLFNAYDLEQGPTASLADSFGSSYDFSGHKLLMRARKVLDHSAAQDAVLYRSARWGASGDKLTVGYDYPSAPDSPIAHTIDVGATVDVRIRPRSGPAVATSVDGTTKWNVTITPNTPVAGVSQVTYTWSGVGTAPALGSLSGGEYVNIGASSGFDSANTGVYRLSTEVGFTPTATSFTVVRPNGAAVAESGVSTLVADSVSFYDNDPTTAAEVVEYVQGALGDYVEAELVDDSGTSGSGVISRSTYEDSDFAFASVQLVDGVNWVLSSGLGASPQFTLKEPLALPTDVGYDFRDGEECRIVPCTPAQVARFMNVLAVTGLSTLADVRLSERSSAVEIATKTPGSEGSVQVVGSAGSSAAAAVFGSASRVDNQLMKLAIPSEAEVGLHGDQWVRVYATERQAKPTGVSAATSVTIDSGVPSAGKSTVFLTGRELSDRYFGKPRHHVRSRGRTFRVERQGRFVCFSWNGSGSSPALRKASIALDDSGGGTLNVGLVGGTDEAEYILLTGDANFSELSIGDLLTVSGLSTPGNNGTFLVTGVSSDGRRARVLNPDAESLHSSGSFTITDNADVAGDDFTVDGTTLEAGVDFPVGATADDTAANLAAAIGAISGVSASSSGPTATVVADVPEASISISYTNNVGLAGATVSGAALVGESFSAGDFSASTEVSEGDQVVVGAPFAVLNRGKFRVVRRFNDSFYIENDSAVEEEVLLSDSLLALSYNGTTQFNVDASSNSLLLSWNGTGTEPTLGLARPGDVVRLGTDFALANRGDFMVLRSSPKLQEVTLVTTPSGAQITGGQRFHLSAANDSPLYYVWYRVDGVGVDPAPGGRTGVQANINSSDSAAAVALATAAALDALADFVAVSNGAVVTVTNSGYGPATDAANVDVGGTFSAVVKVQGTRTFLEAVNPAAATEAGVLVTDVLEVHRPALNFWEYDATLPGDSLVLSGTALPQGAVGSWSVDEVLSRDSAVVVGTPASAFQVSLAGQESSLVVQEEEAYSGYKRTLLVTTEPGVPSLSCMVMDTNAQYDKANESAGASVEAVSKLGFPEGVNLGLDSYRHHTGLLAEVNRIIYGDPRDSTTYSGIAAAGAEIFSRGPLLRRVQLGISVRLKTGVPFAQVVEQIKNSVGALINGNPIGQAIAISQIVSAVNAIPGVRAVAITSPQYDSQNDVIRVQPSEKARVIDPSVDISVTRVD
ncbi:MAG: baseplate J/gp47 family protein [Bdellovibrionales bacterium]|nr:baseplate J/gp47 family protein [Bdellovibrionales bacterium]